MLTIIVSVIINFYEKRYKQNLLNEVSFEKFIKLNVSRLELKRYIKNTQLGSNFRISLSNSKRKEINLDSSTKDKIGISNTLENELTVYAYTKNYFHEVYTCPYSEEDKKMLQNIVNEYNISFLNK